MAVRRLAAEQPANFSFDQENEQWAQKQIAKYPQGRQASAVIPLLWQAQKQAGGWLPEAAIRHVADRLGMPHIRVLEVATFYTMFNLEPVGKHFIQVCGTTPCALRGAEDLIKVCKHRIGEQRDVTADGNFSWQEVECLGACVNAPMVQINDDYYEDLTPALLEKLMDDLAAGKKVKVGPQIERQYSAPSGGLTTLTGENSASRGPSADPALTDANAKRPGEAANFRDAGVPKAPARDESGKGTK
jgi:NADH-quinone oxidoreductase subunit E